MWHASKKKLQRAGIYTDIDSEKNGKDLTINFVQVGIMAELTIYNQDSYDHKQVWKILTACVLVFLIKI